MVLVDRCRYCGLCIFWGCCFVWCCWFWISWCFVFWWLLGRVWVGWWLLSWLLLMLLFDLVGFGWRVDVCCGLSWWWCWCGLFCLLFCLSLSCSWFVLVDWRWWIVWLCFVWVDSGSECWIFWLRCILCIGVLFRVVYGIFVCIDCEWRDIVWELEWWDVLWDWSSWESWGESCWLVWLWCVGL